MPNILSRLGIFAFFDPEGVVDQYVIQLLQSMRPNFERLIVVSNSIIAEAERTVLEQNADAVFVRENHGLDAAAFKAGMVCFCGWEELCCYDEVVLFNDTFFGPIGSFDKMFAEMAERDLDFWGMSAGYPAVDGWRKVKCGYIPSHIQTFFVSFRKQMVQSSVFQNYWNQYDDTMDDFVSVVSNHEMIMTNHFQEHGFRWDIYADTERYHSEYKTENVNLYMFHSYRMMKDCRFPALKKKVLCENLTDYLYMADLEEPSKAMSYIQNSSNYDVNLIWDNVLRLYHISDLYQNLHLNYVLPSVPADLPVGKRIALIYHVTNPIFVQEFCMHAAGMVGVADLYLIPEGDKITQLVEENLNSKVFRKLKASGQKTEMGAFIICCRELAEKYDYLGFVHDIQNEEHAPITVAESTVSGYLQNVAGDRDYLTQVIRCFESYPRIGVLGTPFPIHHHGFSTYGNEWGEWYQATRELAEDLGLRCKISEQKQPFLLTGAFWCRKEAIAGLWSKKWSPKHFGKDHLQLHSPVNEALKRILPYLAQANGFYSGIVMHTDYASMRITGQQYMLDQIVDVTRQKLYCNADCFSGYMHQLQAMGADGGNGLKIDVSQLEIKTIMRIWLESHFPRWLSTTIRSCYRWSKRLCRK